MVTWVTAIGAGVSIATTAAGALSSGGGSAGYQASQESLRKAGEAFSGLATPSLGDLEVRLQQAVFTGAMSPVQAVAMMQRASELEGVQADPRAVYAQMRSLEQLAQTVDMRGMTDADKVQLFATMQDQGGAVAGARGRQQQTLAELGIGDIEAQELERDIAGQAGANRAAKLALQTDADAQARTEAAIASSGQLAGQVRGQSFREQQKQAAAQDAINKANAIAANQFEASNVANLRDVQKDTAETQQTISDVNTQIANQQAEANAKASQQDYENQLAKAKGEAAALGTASQVSGQQANQPGVVGPVLESLGTLASTYANRAK